VLDWSDTGECHESLASSELGQIYKITYGEAKAPASRDLTKLQVEQLVSFILMRNEWFVRQARLQLLERTGDSEREKAKKLLLQMFQREGRYGRQAQGAIGRFMGLEERMKSFWRPQLSIRTNMCGRGRVKLLSDGGGWIRLCRPARKFQTPDSEHAPVREFVEMAKSDPAPMVRWHWRPCYSVCRFRNAAVGDRLLVHGEDARIIICRLMIWFGLIPVAGCRTRDAGSLGADAKLRRFES